MTVLLCCAFTCASNAFSWEKHWNEYYSSVIASKGDFAKQDKRLPITPEIKATRMGFIKIRTKPFADIIIKQTDHDFWFGTAISENIFGEHSKDYKSVIRDNFNSVVFENAMKWSSMEPEKDKWNFETVDKLVNWCITPDPDHSKPRAKLRPAKLRVRGHCVFWSDERKIKEWIKQLPLEDLKQAIKDRASNLLTHDNFPENILEYDVNNEMLLHNDSHGFYKKHLGDSIPTEMFQWCHEADSNAVLYVNDFGILDGDYISQAIGYGVNLTQHPLSLVVDVPAVEKYAHQIRELINNNAPVGGIGLQGHFSSGKVDAKKVKHVLDRLSSFNLPIKITEFDISTDVEKNLAKGLYDLFHVCFAHPNVEGILLWGFRGDDSWLNSEEYRKDPKNSMAGKGIYPGFWSTNFKPTDAGFVYRDLVYNQWWTEWEGKADKYGVCEVPAFFGPYEIEINGKIQTFELRNSYEDKTLLINDNQVFVVVIKPENPSEDNYIPTGKVGPVAKMGNRVSWWRKFLSWGYNLFSNAEPKELGHDIQISNDAISFSFPHKSANTKTPIYLFNKIEEAGKEIIIINESEQKVQVSAKKIQGIEFEGTSDMRLLNLEGNSEESFKIYPVSGYPLFDKSLTMNFKVGDTTYTKQIPIQITTSEY